MSVVRNCQPDMHPPALLPCLNQQRLLCQLVLKILPSVLFLEISFVLTLNSLSLSAWTLAFLTLLPTTHPNLFNHGFSRFTDTGVELCNSCSNTSLNTKFRPETCFMTLFHAFTCKDSFAFWVLP